MAYDTCPRKVKETAAPKVKMPLRCRFRKNKPKCDADATCDPMKPEAGKANPRWQPCDPKPSSLDRRSAQIDQYDGGTTDPFQKHAPRALGGCRVARRWRSFALACPAHLPAEGRAHGVAVRRLHNPTSHFSCTLARVKGTVFVEPDPGPVRRLSIVVNRW